LIPDRALTSQVVEVIWAENWAESEEDEKIKIEMFNYVGYCKDQY